MATLHGFPDVPPRGDVPLCEVNGVVCSMRRDHADISNFTTAVSRHPCVNVTRDFGTRDEVFSPYLEVEDNLLKRLTSVWYKQGFLETLRVAADPQNGIENKLLAYAALYVLKASDFFTRLRHIFQPHLKDLGPKLTSLYSHTRDWSTSSVRCIAWHPHMTKIAVGTADDTVRIYSPDSALVPILKCTFQKGVSALSWRPLSVSEIAIGCENGVIIWTVDPNSTFAKPSMNNTVILTSSGHSPITSLGWSPDGDYLVSASAADYGLKVWNPAGGEPCTISRLAGGGTSHLKWAPDGSRLFTATTGIIFRVWETQRWKTERWSVRGGRVQSACWSPCSQILLFATEEEPLVYALKFANATLFAVNNNIPATATPIIDLTRVELNNGEVVGGTVLDLQYSPKGHHVAVTFKESPYVAVFNINVSHSIQVTPCCFVSGTETEKANVIAFQQNFKEGACLTIGWSSGRVQHFPIIYDYLEPLTKLF